MTVLVGFSKDSPCPMHRLGDIPSMTAELGEG